MRKRTSLMLICLSMATLSSSIMAADEAKTGAAAPVVAEQPKAPTPAPVKEVTGKELAFDNKKGNCLACHAMPNLPDAISAGTIGPPLIVMKSRYPSRDKLRAQIWDAMQTNPNTSMPPFGKHKVLTEAEIDKITDFIHSL